jgi:hypothetical protein
LCIRRIGASPRSTTCRRRVCFSTRARTARHGREHQSQACPCAKQAGRKSSGAIGRSCGIGAGARHCRHRLVRSGPRLGLLDKKSAQWSRLLSGCQPSFMPRGMARDSQTSRACAFSSDRFRRGAATGGCGSAIAKRQDPTIERVEGFRVIRESWHAEDVPENAPLSPGK